MKKVALVLAALVLATMIASAQELAVTVSPNPAPLGAPITITAQATVPNLYTPFGCLVSEIRSGSPSGPTAALFPCTFLGVAIPLYGSPTVRTSVWNQQVSGGGFATPGVYWCSISHTPGLFGSPTTTEWFSVTIHDPNNNPNPTLSAVTAPLFGSSFDMHLDAGSANAGAPYGAACSFTSNTGIPFTGGVASLDPDNLFFLSLNQDPAFFLNFQGVLDQAGQSGQPIRIMIPPVLGVLCIPIHAQAVVFQAGGALILSNDLLIPIH